MEITHVVGARPNFVKAAPVIEALTALRCHQRIIHTGQHYDEKMSNVFFVQLGLPRPDVNLGVGSGSHGAQTASVIAGVERELQTRRPDLLMVYGDVNSTLGAALAAVKLGIPVGHVEAGLRCDDLTMPEEWNRRLTDQMSTLLFATSPEAIGHLSKEGRPVSSVHLVGNTMIDTLVACMDKLNVRAVRTSFGLPETYLVSTLHRPFNVDTSEAVRKIVTAMYEVADQADVIIPMHPRGATAFKDAGLSEHPRIHIVGPLGYLEFMSLVRGATAVITDSSGLQEETTFLRVPCLTLRPITERPITIIKGSNRLVSSTELATAVADAIVDGPYTGELPPLWDGRSGCRIAHIITKWL